MTQDTPNFTDKEKKLLERYVTNIDKNVFVMRNLPEVIKGALFSRYSRSSLGLRRLLLKEFIGDNNKESGFSDMTVSDSSLSEEAVRKAQNFYDRILDGYGDDSIAELGGAHVAFEDISMIAAKVVEDARIGGSPLEKSTRYIPFHQKHNGKYAYVREKAIMGSSHASLYESTCDMLFDTYASLIEPITKHMKLVTPQSEGTSDAAYNAALRASVFDALRGLLPASTKTNMGMFGNGRFFEGLIQRLHFDEHQEMQDIGDTALSELNKVIPSFVRRAHKDHRHHVAHKAYNDHRKAVEKKFSSHHVKESKEGVRVELIHSSDDIETSLAAALLFESSHASYESVYEYAQKMTLEEKKALFQDIASQRTNRRHKSPRALEHISFTFSMCGDYGSYRDLHRHRMLTQERRPLSCNHGFYTPQPIKDAGFEDVYVTALSDAQKAYDVISKEFPVKSQYVVPMAYNIEWYFHGNLRSFQWITELRSQPQGHETYRHMAHLLANAITTKYPSLSPFFTFVDFSGQTMGRLAQEERKSSKQTKSV